MRIIKFRVWVFESDIKKGYMLDIYENFEKDCNSDYYLVYEDFRDLEDGRCKNCIPLQFTGLHDKNGKEIYEGDIILFQKFSNWDDESMKRHKATVIFKEGCFMWEILEFGKKSVTYYANATEPLRNTNSIWGLEVIGNIYENQELLENKFAD